MLFLFGVNCLRVERWLYGFNGLLLLTVCTCKGKFLCECECTILYFIFMLCWLYQQSYLGRLCQQWKILNPLLIRLLKRGLRLMEIYWNVSPGLAIKVFVLGKMHTALSCPTLVGSVPKQKNTNARSHPGRTHNLCVPHYHVISLCQLWSNFIFYCFWPQRVTTVHPLTHLPKQII